MNENRDLRSRLVVGQKRDGRREFDEDAVRELVALCLKPGVSIARAAMDHDVNPNLAQLSAGSFELIERRIRARVKRATALPQPFGAPSAYAGSVSAP